MKRQIALAYAVASLATAIAIIAVMGSVVGWSDSAEDGPPPGPAEQVAVWPTSDVGAVPPIAPVQEEVVYVDETGAPLLGPPTGRHDDDDDDDHHDDDDDDHDRRHRDHDDD